MKKSKKNRLSLSKKTVSDLSKLRGGNWNPGGGDYTVPCTLPTIGFCNTAGCDPNFTRDAGSRCKCL